MRKNIFYFYGGGIGGFLLGLFFLENIKINYKNNFNYYILVPKNKELYTVLVKKYDYIKIIEINNIKDLIFSIFLNIFSINKIFLAPSFGGHSRYMIYLFKVLIFFRKNSFLAGFDSNEYSYNKFNYSFFINRDLNISIFNDIKKFLNIMNCKNVLDIHDFNFLFNETTDILNSVGLSKYKYVLIHPFAANLNRSLPFNRWVSIIKHLLSSGHVVVMTGAKKDICIASKITKNINSEKFLNLAGKTNLNETINLINCSKYYIGVDTGITHLAALLKKRGLIIANYSNPYWLPFYNKKFKLLFNISSCPCAPCNKKKCLDECKKTYFRCILDIKQNDIYSIIDNI